MDERTLWAVMLLGLAVVLFIVEILVPSGGLIGLLAASALIGGIIMLFWINTTLGLVSALVCIVAIPFLLAGMLRIWPNTPFFRALALGNPDDDAPEQGKASSAPTAAKADEHSHGLHVGDLGVAETSLRPVGMCRINGKREECMAEGPLIDSGKKIRITHIDGMQIKVRAM